MGPRAAKTRCDGARRHIQADRDVGHAHLFDLVEDEDGSQLRGHALQGLDDENPRSLKLQDLLWVRCRIHGINQLLAEVLAVAHRLTMG